jgi:hypothetical protein
MLKLIQSAKWVKNFYVVNAMWSVAACAATVVNAMRSVAAYAATVINAMRSVEAYAATLYISLMT